MHNITMKSSSSLRLNIKYLASLAIAIVLSWKPHPTEMRQHI